MGDRRHPCSATGSGSGSGLQYAGEGSGADLAFQGETPQSRVEGSCNNPGKRSVGAVVSGLTAGARVRRWRATTDGRTRSRPDRVTGAIVQRGNA